MVNRHVFLSPHFDDVALSCGGWAAALANAGARGLCLTVFAGPPPPDAPLNPYAQRLHTRWGMPDPVGGNALRRAEEAAATRLLGLDLRLLDYPDAIYRGDRYASHAGIFGAVHPAESDLAARLTGDLAAVLAAGGPPESVILYAPLGLGHHVDHQLAHAAARQLAGRGYPVRYYEDYPYAAEPAARAERFAELGLVPGETAAPPGGGRAIPEYRAIDATIETKIAAIAAYASQISSLFPSREAMPGAVRTYAAAVAAGWRAAAPPGSVPDPPAGYAERYWQITPA